jgi:predicted amidohydrolase YtcJ
MTDAPVLWSGGRIVTGDPGNPQAEAMVVRGGRMTFVGGAAEAAERAGPGATRRDLAGGTVLPGFVDGHAHVVMAGEALLRAPLTDAPDLAAIQQRVQQWAKENPDAPRVLGRGWLFSAVPGGRPTRQMLDEVVPDRPVYLDANDYHSVWVNSAALAELGVTRDTPDPLGGRIVRAAGEPTGHLEETAAQQLAWEFLGAASTDADRDRALRAATAAYLASGVTSVVDMALDEHGLAAMLRAERAGRLDLRVVAHWFVHRAPDPAEHLVQVRRAAELAQRHRSERLRVTGVKFVVDGVIDGCTASMLRPYADGGNADPIWDLDALAPAVAAADAAGLQVALHAIGDRAARIALDALEHAHRENGPGDRRHRIEHLEYVDPADVPRLAELGVTASMQPVHADPAIRDNWAAMLGDSRAERGFAWPEMTAAGARLAFGTDAPTAPHPPLPNMFIAHTRRSALKPELPAQQPHLALPLVEAVTHGTADSAWACRAEDALGRLAPGLLADFVVLDRDPFTADPASLLEARVLRTVVDGTTGWEA